MRLPMNKEINFKSILLLKELVASSFNFVIIAAQNKPAMVMFNSISQFIVVVFSIIIYYQIVEKANI